MKLLFFLAVSLLLIGTNFAYSSQPSESDSANPITIKKILLYPDDYDGKNVKISGRVRSISSERGKRGSEYLAIIIENPQTFLKEETETLKVFIYFSPRLKKGSTIIVSGIYHKWGHWGGMEQEHFIEANEIIPVEIN